MTPFTEAVDHLRGERALSRAEREELAMRLEAQVAALVEAARDARDLLELICQIDPSADPQEGSIGHALRTALDSFGENA